MLVAEARRLKSRNKKSRTTSQQFFHCNYAYVTFRCVLVTACCDLVGRRVGRQSAEVCSGRPRDTHALIGVAHPCDLWMVFMYIIYAKVCSTRNVWQSLAYSPLGVVVSPPSKYLWNTPNYWSPECITDHPIVKMGGNDYQRRPYTFFRLKLRSHWTESYKISKQCIKIIAD